MTPAQHDACCEALMSALAALGQGDVFAVKLALVKARQALDLPAKPLPMPTTDARPSHWLDKVEGDE